MFEVDVILTGQRSAQRRRDQVEEHSLVALVKIVVDWVQPDIHGVRPGREPNGRSTAYAIEPIVFAQSGRTLLRVEKHEELTAQIARTNRAELSPVDVVLEDECFRSARVNQLE